MNDNQPEEPIKKSHKGWVIFFILAGLLIALFLMGKYLGEEPEVVEDPVVNEDIRAGSPSEYDEYIPLPGQDKG